MASGNPGRVRISLSYCMLSSFPGLAQGREFCQVMACEQVLIAMGELMAQNRPSIAFGSGDGTGERKEEVISLCVRVAFSPTP